MSISPRFMQDLRDRLTLSEVIGRRVKLTRAGREFKGCCPFHREKSPSFYVNDDKQFFHCFGCGAHGDVLGFVMRHDNLSFIEATEALAAQAGLAVPQQSAQDQEYAKKEKSLYALCEATAKWFEAQLHDGRNHEVLGYLTGRGVSADMLDSFRLGYAPSDEQALRRHLKADGYSDVQMVEAGVIKMSTKGTEPYAFFRDRVMFPVTDARGRIVAFGGRILPDHMRPPSRGDFKPPKYINSADTPLFHKGRTLYAGQLARLAAKDHTLIVVEGYMDVMACHQAGFRGAVAPLGTALTEEQIAILWKTIPHDIKEPVLCFDGDEAGYRAALRAAERVLPLLKAHQSVRFAFLPEGDDPDTYIRDRGISAFSGLIERAIPLVEFLWTHNVAGRRFDTPESRAGLSGKLEELAAQIPERDLQYHYRQMFRDKLRVFLGGMWQGVGKNTGQGGKNSGKKKINDVVILPPLGRRKADMLQPQILLATLINHPAIYPYFINEISRLEMGAGDLQSLAHVTAEILETELENDSLEQLDRDALLAHIRARGLETVLENLLQNKPIMSHAGFSRADIGDDVAKDGWKSVWNQWDKSFEVDLQHARQALSAAMTPENEERVKALLQIRQANEAATD